MNEDWKKLWDMPMLGLQDRDLKHVEHPRTLRETRKGSVTNGFDMEAHIDSEDGRRQAENWEHFIKYRDEMDPRVLEYWRGLGWEKSLRDTDVPDRRWSCFTPISSLRPENAGRKYPLYFVMHGGITPVYEMEGYGMIQPTAKDEPFVIIPWKIDPPRFLEIYRYAVEHFPIDRGRVYIFSYCGGSRANHFALRYPELFAAIAPCGNPLRENYKPVLWWPDVERVQRLGMPCIHIDGLDDVTQLLPCYATGDAKKSEDPDYPGRTFNMPLGRREYKVNCLRDLLFIHGCRDVTPQEVYACETSGDPVKRMTGVPGDSTQVCTVLGKKHYVADFRNRHGEDRLRIVGIESMGHFPDASLGIAAWEYMRRFRRNMETGAIEVIGEENAPKDVGGFDPDRYQHDYGSREMGYTTAWDGTPV